MTVPRDPCFQVREYSSPDPAGKSAGRSRGVSRKEGHGFSWRPAAVKNSGKPDVAELVPSLSSRAISVDARRATVDGCQNRRRHLWKFRENRIAVSFQYDWHDADRQWYRSYGTELWNLMIRA